MCPIMASLCGDKYQGCYFNYPDRQPGANCGGDKADPGEVYSGDFSELHFGPEVAVQLKAIKVNVVRLISSGLHCRSLRSDFILLQIAFTAFCPGLGGFS